MSQLKVTLLLPGYTSESPLAQDSSEADIMPRAPVSDADLGLHFSDDLSRQPWQAQLASILGFDTDEGRRLPSATLAANTVSEPLIPVGVEGLVCADPIGLKADRDSATLISPQQLGLSEQEADKLLETLNGFLAEDGLTFFRQDAAQWFMNGMNADALASYPPSFLANRKASTFLPEGDDAAPWRRLLTEIQMLLHTHPVNLQRESNGLTPVNSVWFWGGAPLPKITSVERGIELYADSQQAQSMAAAMGVSVKPLSAVQQALDNLPFAADTVIVDTALVNAWLAGDAGRLEQRLSFVSEQWLQPLSQLVANKHLAEVQLLTEDGLQGLCNLQTMAEASAATSTGLLGRLRSFFKL